MIIDIKGNIINTEGIDSVTSINKECEPAYNFSSKEMVDDCTYFFQILFVSGSVIEIEDKDEIKAREYYNKISKAMK